MKRIAWVILGWLVSVTMALPEGFDCYQKKFVNCGVEIPLDVKKSLTKIYPNSEILSEDLDRDGINDFVVFTSEKTIDGIVDKVVVLKGKPDGAYDELAKSKGIEHGTATMGIKKQSIYITVIHNSINESNTEIYQFKYRSGGIILIGKEEISYLPVDENHGNEAKTSTNYLTGEVIAIEMADGKTKETKSRLGKNERKLLRLEDFSR